MLEKFRNNSLKNYGLWASHYLNVAGLNWAAMLKMTKIELTLIPYPGMCIFFEKGTRGGIPYISNRCSNTNNYSKPYDPKEELEHIIYLDTNNLYCYAMSQFLPKSEFK